MYQLQSILSCSPPSTSPPPLPPSSLSSLLVVHRFSLSALFCYLLSVLLCHVYLCFPFKPGSSSPLKTSTKHLSVPPASICDCCHTLCPVWLIFTCTLPLLLSLCLTPPPPSLSFSNHPPVAMLERMSRRSRSLLSLTLTTLALALSILALCTSYWCEGTHKVVKPLCLSPVKMKNCGQNNSEPYTTGTEMSHSHLCTSESFLCNFIVLYDSLLFLFIFPF